MLSTAAPYVPRSGRKDPHKDCYRYENCGHPDCPAVAHKACCRDENCGRRGCPPYEAELRREEAARRGAWHAIEVPTGEGAYGSYHTLDGEPLNCGSCIELQAFGEDEDDYGEYRVWKQEGTKVRYEIAHEAAPGGGQRRVPMLYASVSGYSFTAKAETWMRFRWPARGGR